MPRMQRAVRILDFLQGGPNRNLVYGGIVRLNVSPLLLNGEVLISISIVIELQKRCGEVLLVGENQEDIGQAVKVYKALGEPTRLKIALLLAKESNLCFTAVGERLESVAGSTLSHHLKQLTDSGLIDFRKNGSFIHYNINREIAEKFAPFLLA